MKAITIHEFGGPEVLQVEEVGKPVPKENEVLIEVHGSSLNPVDVKSISKDSIYKSRMHLPVTAGMDVAGIVEMTGKDVKNIHTGDRVFGQASALRKGSGAFAEYAVTSEEALAIMPRSLNFVEAASVPLAASSAYVAIFEHMKLQTGNRVLIHGGSGGIGSFAIQLAKYAGAHVTTTATGEGIGFVQNLGADEVIDYKTEAFEKLRDFDAVLDTIGGDTYKKSFQVVKTGGILVSMLAKPDEDLMKQYGVNAILEMTKVERKVLSEIASLLDRGVLKVKIASVYPLDETKEAYKAKAEKQILGKIAITIKHHN